jgi:hypothetical protein
MQGVHLAGTPTDSATSTGASLFQALAFAWNLQATQTPRRTRSFRTPGWSLAAHVKDASSTA